MKIIDIKRLDGENFNPVFINALRQFWKSTKSFQCIGNPKNQNLILFLDGCKATYTDKYGNTYVAKSTDVVYTPLGSEYRANLSDFVSPESHTVGINFLLFDEACEPIVLSDKIEIFHIDRVGDVASAFDRAALIGRDGTTLSNRIILMEILSLLMDEPLSGDNSIVYDTVEYLSKNIEENPSVGALAKRCNVSEVYLRKKFKESMGVSPSEYRNKLRLDKAASYLKYGDISVQEISDTLKYSTVSHFIKEFKSEFGISPLQYRKREKN